MTGKQVAKRQDKADHLRVFKVSDREYFVESEKEKILYKVNLQNETKTCTCGDYTANVQKDESFQCKHILAAQNGHVENINGNAKPKLSDKFITTIQGTEFVKYSGLLDLAHQKGIQTIHVEPVQFPTKDNGYEAICKATVESSNNDVYIEWGDANPKNVNRKIVNHILRMAATRAKARCLRDYTNIGITCLEELGGDDVPETDAGSQGKTDASENASGEVIPMKKQKQASGSSQKNQTKGSSKTQKPNADKQTDQAKPSQTQKQQNTDTQTDQAKPSQAQKRAIENLAQRRGMTLEDLDNLCQKTLGVQYEYLTASDAAQFIKTLQQSG